MYWIDIRPDAETFATPQEALTDWMRDHQTLPSAVHFKSVGRYGSVAVHTEGPRIKKFSAGTIRYALGQTTWYDDR
jgi:hypothetical protein